MRDLEVLLTSVRSSKTRRLLEETVRAYQAGAYRAAIIGTWVAVALDIVEKLRELADNGDAAATQQIADLDRAITTRNVPALQAFENSLLDMSLNTFELLSGRDHQVLSRLQVDRHICAHPAFVAPDQVFRPTAEDARAHISNAVDALLCHPPTPGRITVARFLAEAGTQAWPESQPELVAYLRERYYDRVRASARRQLAELVVKSCLQLPSDAPHRERLVRRYPLIARAFEEIDPELVSTALSNVVRKREELTGLTESELLNASGSLGSSRLFWDSLPESSWPRIRACVENSDLDILVAAGAFALSPPPHAAAEAVAAVLDRRVKELNAQELAISLEREASARILEAATRLLIAGQSWNNTNILFPAVAGAASNLSKGQLKRILDAATTVYDVVTAKASDHELRRVFISGPHKNELRANWIEVAKSTRTDSQPPSFAYPQLRGAISEEWGDGSLFENADTKGQAEERAH